MSNKALTTRASAFDPALHSAPRLATLQRWFQSVITHPDGLHTGAAASEALSLAPLSRGDLERIVTRSENLTAGERIAIYANAYYARLIECMGDTFPVLKATLGQPAFSGFVFAYLQEFPSRSYTLGKLGEHFVRFLETTRPDDEFDDARNRGELPAGWPDFLIDLARLEWAIAEVFDAPGTERMETLTSITSAELEINDLDAVRVKLAPNLRLISTRFPVNDFYTTVRRAPDAVPVVPPAPATSYIAISRRDYIVRRHDLNHAQYILLRELQGGRRLGQALEQASAVYESDDETFAANLSDWFEYWTRNRFVIEIQYAKPG